jgi:hypothetical protein
MNGTGPDLSGAPELFIVALFFEMGYVSHHSRIYAYKNPPANITQEDGG